MDKSKKAELIKIVVDQRDKARHWKFCHYDSSRKYEKIDSWLGLPSVVLATIILGFAFSSVGRNDIPIYMQIILAALTVLQGILLIVKLYLKPSYLAESHRNAAASLGSLGRKWAVLEARLNLEDETVTVDVVEEIMSIQDTISRESNPIPDSILKKNGLRPVKRNEKDMPEIAPPVKLYSVKEK